jgi:hypothetical protein
MPITPFLYGLKVEPETKRVMGVAFEMARAALQLGSDDPAMIILARRIIGLAKQGVLILIDSASKLLRCPTCGSGRVTIAYILPRERQTVSARR